MLSRARKDTSKDVQPKKTGKTWLPVNIEYREKRFSRGEFCCLENKEDCGELKTDKPLTVGEKHTLILTSGPKKFWTVLIKEQINGINLRYKVQVVKNPKKRKS